MTSVMMKWLAFFSFVLLAGIIFLADRGRIPGFLAGLYAFPNGDKVGHFLLIGGMALLANLGLAPVQPVPSSRKSLARRIFAISLAVAGLVALEEISQFWIPARTFSLVDLSFSILGIAFGGLLAFLFKIRRIK